MSAHRDPDVVAEYAKNAKMRGLRVIIAGRRPGRSAPGSGRRAHRPARDRRAADVEDLGRRRARRHAGDRADAPGRPGGVRRGRLGEERRRARRAYPRRVIERYTRPEMGAVWSEQSKLDGWLAVELAVVDALAEAGVVPADDAAAIRARASFSVEAVKEREKITDHDVAAFVDVVAASVGEEGRWVPPRADVVRRARHGARAADRCRGEDPRRGRARVSATRSWRRRASTWRRSASGAPTASTPSRRRSA